MLWRLLTVPSPMLQGFWKGRQKQREGEERREGSVFLIA